MSSTGVSESDDPIPSNEDKSSREERIEIPSMTGTTTAETIAVVLCSPHDDNLSLCCHDYNLSLCCHDICLSLQEINNCPHDTFGIPGVESDTPGTAPVSKGTPAISLGLGTVPAPEPGYR